MAITTLFGSKCTLFYLSIFLSCFQAIRCTFCILFYLMMPALSTGYRLYISYPISFIYLFALLSGYRLYSFSPFHLSKSLPYFPVIDCTFCTLFRLSIKLPCFLAIDVKPYFIYRYYSLTIRLSTALFVFYSIYQFYCLTFCHFLFIDFFCHTFWLSIVHFPCFPSRPAHGRWLKL